MKFLIIGASGLVGRHVLAHVRAEGHEAIGSRSHFKDDGLIEFDLLKHRIREQLPASFQTGDDPAISVISVKFGPMDDYVGQEELSRLVEVEKTLLLVEDLIELGIKPVVLSSSYVFDGEIGSYGEDDPLCPLSIYGRNKAEVERRIENLSETILTLRLDKIVGADPSEEHMFSEWFRCLSEDRPIVCIQGQVFAPTLVDDIARGILLCSGANLSGLYNFANPDFFEREELARQFAGALGTDAAITSKPQEEMGLLEVRPMKSHLDSSKLVRDTGFRFTPMPEVFGSFARIVR